MSQSRLNVFDQYLQANAIPYNGLSVSTNPPGPTTVTIDFKAEATQQQIDFANAAIQTFDWRPRAFLSTSTIVSTIQGLTAQQKTAFTNWVLANWVKDNEAKVIEALSTLQFSLPYDQVAP